MPVKFQMVVDPLIAECLEHLPGRTKTDKIRWALSIYRELEMMKRDRTMTQWTGREALEELMARATTRYRAEVNEVQHG